MADVEWMRAKQILAQFGIGRSTLYRLAAEGRIESKLIKTANASKGTRVFSIQSIRALLANSLS
jgi:predicted site-specific integrase-resolvase